jgi:hypothetical protein
VGLALFGQEFFRFPAAVKGYKKDRPGSNIERRQYKQGDMGLHSYNHDEQNGRYQDMKRLLLKDL